MLHRNVANDREPDATARHAAVRTAHEGIEYLGARRLADARPFVVDVDHCIVPIHDDRDPYLLASWAKLHRVVEKIENQLSKGIAIERQTRTAMSDQLDRRAPCRGDRLDRLDRFPKLLVDVDLLTRVGKRDGARPAGKMQDAIHELTESLRLSIDDA